MGPTSKFFFLYLKSNFEVFFSDSVWNFLPTFIFNKIWPILASQGLRFVSPFSPPLADLEYNLKFARNATWWFIEVAPLRKSSSPANQNRFVIRMLESWKWQLPVKKNLFVINLIWKHLLSTKWKFQSFGRRERCFHWNKNGKWQIVVIWEHSGAIFVYISWITCAPCKTSSDWIRVLVNVANEILKCESSKCILDLPRVERRGTRIVTLG
jgi:hypothetical protein